MKAPIIFLLIAFTLTFAGQANANPWKVGPCVSQYDGVSPAACPYSKKTIDDFVSVCTKKLGDRIHARRLKNEAWDTDDLLKKGEVLCGCIVSEIRMDYTEEFFLEWIMPGNNNSAQAADILTTNTNICAVELDIYKPGYKTYTE